MEFNLQILDIYPSIDEIKSNASDNLIFTVISSKQNEHIFNFEDLLSEKMKISLNSNEIKYNLYKNEKLLGNGTILINSNSSSEIKWITVNNVLENSSNSSNKSKFKFNNNLKFSLTDVIKIRIKTEILGNNIVNNSMFNSNSKLMKVNLLII